MPLLFWLLVGHGLCDYPLQGDFLARGKNQRNPLPGVPWYQCLFWHALIHGGAVGLVTMSMWAAICETVLHVVIDFGKSEGYFGFNVDQAAHVGCKVLYVALLAWWS